MENVTQVLLNSDDDLLCFDSFSLFSTNQYVTYFKTKNHSSLFMYNNHL